MKTALTWRHLKALNQLYVDKRTTAKITDNGYITNVLMTQKKLLKFRSGNDKILEATPKYFAFYEENLKQDFDHYAHFLQTANVEDDARRKYSEDDIKTLMFIADYKEEICKTLTTIRTFSAEVFKNHGSKYLENKPGLKNAVCKILGINDFPDKDPKSHQWRLVLDCLNPTAIILCENIAHLKNPWKVREANLELWYVGGNNINMIDFIDSEKLALPIFYSCDWDYHGLSIYSRIKSKMKLKSAEIKLLYPHTIDIAIPTNAEHHKSNWNFNLPLSGLNRSDFEQKETGLIDKLIESDRWIEEESMDIIKLYEHNTY